MSKDDFIKMLENFIQKEELNAKSPFKETDYRNKNVIQAMDLLASVQGWKSQFCMKRQHGK